MKKGYLLQQATKEKEVLAINLGDVKEEVQELKLLYKHKNSHSQRRNKSQADC